MIVVDASALVAIIAGEPDANTFAAALSERDEIYLSTATAVETFIVVGSRWGGEGRARLEQILTTAGIRLQPVDERLMRMAIEGFDRFGRGSGHPARLNYGDCFSYALARVLDAPLLFKGDDFIHTDVRSAL
ncbi:type II toxin-antitoxin system VapC family toxin [Aureimonas pseudogalii]|uniref:Ribonuclease VapC n=1 Tax=Aureimonas pseudogalii TaxID=1744844 RepID=A0A7W6EFR1_9HYPH|nr:type II toxin-antitoxin system VapC family toxin [Aureimonas pseudogalii]MBB3997845.1 ribonuclease VapC [Aureimonas pseudogalii]